MNSDETASRRGVEPTAVKPPRWYRFAWFLGRPPRADGTAVADARPRVGGRVFRKLRPLSDVAEPETDPAGTRHRRKFARADVVVRPQRCVFCAVDRAVRRPLRPPSRVDCDDRRVHGDDDADGAFAEYRNLRRAAVPVADVRRGGSAAGDGRHRRRVRARKSWLGNRRGGRDSVVRGGFCGADVRVRRRPAVRLARVVCGRRDPAVLHRVLAAHVAGDRTVRAAQLTRARSLPSRCRCSPTSGAPRANIRVRLRRSRSRSCASASRAVRRVRLRRSICRKYTAGCPRRSQR